VAPRFPLTLSLSGPDTGALVHALAPALPQRDPGDWSVDFQPGEGPWLDAIAGARELAAVEWDDASLGVVPPNGHVRVELPRTPSRAAALELLTAAPFTVATLPSYAATWSSEHGYRAPGFDGGHGPHGWACAFRGDGHDRLVSRRWLPHGPWELTRDEPDDISFVRFHDPDAAPAAALEQARAGHERMGIDDGGGYIQLAPILAGGLPGLYEDGTHKVVVHDRDVPPRELLGACQIRRDRRDDPQAPIARIAYVFTEPERAAAHLPALWLRELQCWAVERGAERRLDGDAAPAALTA
jgi:hypothetical protein